MSQTDKPQIGSLGWVDLTVNNADQIVEFYKNVVGWEIDKFNMGDYDDYILKLPGTNIPVAGICNAKGLNKDIPPVWLNYFTVENVDISADECVKMGGSLIIPPKKMGEYGRFCIIKDPAGVICALFTPTA